MFVFQGRRTCAAVRSAARASAKVFKPDRKKEKSDRRERGKGLREKSVQRGKPTGKRREGGCRILLRFSFSPLSLSQEVFLFGRQEAAAEKS
jgi:hypothetical protein